MNSQPISQFAGLKIRLKAFAFDYLLVAGYIVLVSVVTLVLTLVFSLFGKSLTWPGNPYLADLLAFIILILPVILYFSLQESSQKQATWGKKKVGIHVQNYRRERISWTRAFLRSVLKFLPWQIAHTCIFHAGGFSSDAELSPVIIGGFILAYILVILYFLSIQFSKYHIALYDRIVGTFVVTD